MKTLRNLFAFVTLAFFLASCEDDAEKAVLNTMVASNELKLPSSTTYVLSLENKDNVMETFEWTAPDFGFPAAGSYELQVDVAGNNFAYAQEIASGTTLSAPVNVGAFNDVLLGLG